MSKRKRVLWPQVIFPLVVILLFAAYYLSRGSAADRMNLYYHMTMDTMVELRFAGPEGEGEDLKTSVFEEMERLERLFSRTVGESDISLVNHEAGRKPVEVSPEVLEVAAAALEYARLSGGAFDPTVGALLDRWGFLNQEYHLPSAEELAETLPLVDYTLVEVDPVQSTLYLPAAGMTIDLGGIAKGYIVDRAVEILKEGGVESAFINAGGDIALIGLKPDGEPWRIGIRHPRQDGQVIAVLPASDLAVVTSGDYERVFEKDGVIYHHILDPAGGMPARSLASATVSAPKAVDADALSTAVFVLGPERGMELIESIPGAEAILITPELEILVSGGLRDNVEFQPDEEMGEVASAGD